MSSRTRTFLRKFIAALLLNCTLMNSGSEVLAANGDNICKNKSVSASSPSTNEHLATDGLLVNRHRELVFV